MRRSRLPSDCVVSKLDLGPECIGAFANEGKIRRGYPYAAHDGPSNAVDGFAELDDWDDRFATAEQFEKRFPVAQELVGTLGQVFSRRIAEIECQMSTDRMGNQTARDENLGATRGP